MRIAHFVESTDSRFGGVPRFVLDASRVMADRGHRTTLMTFDSADTPASWIANSENNALPYVRTLKPGRVLGRESLSIARGVIMKSDVLHLHNVWCPSNLQLSALARSMGVPYVVSTHGMLDDWCMGQRSIKKRIYMALGARRMLENAARVHCTAEFETRQAVKWFPRGQSQTIPYIIDLEPYRTLPGMALAQRAFPVLQSKKEPTILFLSRLHYKKGCEHLIRAAAIIAQHGNAAKFIFAGTGDDAYITSLKNLASELGIASRVHFLGQVRGLEKISVYQNADLFVLPTSQENFGLVLTESLSAGTPVVTTRGVDIWQDIVESGAGLVTEQNADALATTIAGLLNNPEQLRAMGEKARPWVFSTFEESTIATQFERTYAQVVGEAQARAVPATFRKAAAATA